MESLEQYWVNVEAVAEGWGTPQDAARIERSFLLNTFPPPVSGEQLGEVTNIYHTDEGQVGVMQFGPGSVDFIDPGREQFRFQGLNSAENNPYLIDQTVTETALRTVRELEDKFNNGFYAAPYFSNFLTLANYQKHVRFITPNPQYPLPTDPSEENPNDNVTTQTIPLENLFAPQKVTSQEKRIWRPNVQQTYGRRSLRSMVGAISDDATEGSLEGGPGLKINASDVLNADKEFYQATMTDSSNFKLVFMPNALMRIQTGPGPDGEPIGTYLTLGLPKTLSSELFTFRGLSGGFIRPIDPRSDMIVMQNAVDPNQHLAFYFKQNASTNATLYQLINEPDYQGGLWFKGITNRLLPNSSLVTDLMMGQSPKEIMAKLWANAQTLAWRPRLILSASTLAQNQHNVDIHNSEVTLALNILGLVGRFLRESKEGDVKPQRGDFLKLFLSHLFNLDNNPPAPGPPPPPSGSTPSTPSARSPSPQPRQRRMRPRLPPGVTPFIPPEDNDPPQASREDVLQQFYDEIMKEIQENNTIQQSRMAEIMQRVNEVQDLYRQRLAPFNERDSGRVDVYPQVPTAGEWLEEITSTMAAATSAMQARTRQDDNMMTFMRNEMKANRESLETHQRSIIQSEMAQLATLLPQELAAEMLTRAQPDLRRPNELTNEHYGKIIDAMDAMRGQIAELDNKMTSDSDGRPFPPDGSPLASAVAPRGS